MTSLPTGTVTFLFSDIEGSTQMAQRLGAAWPSVLEQHREIVRKAIAAGGGTEVGTEGDSFFVAFPTAQGAVQAAVSAARGLAAHQWDEGSEVRIRIGLHTGEGNQSGGDYVGIDVHRAARVAAAGHGGQVLLSETTRVLAEPVLPTGVTLRDLGQRRLKDLSRPEHIHQLVIEGLPADFPPLKTLDATPNNLPVQLSSFLGREQELAEVESLLGKTRLLTLTGPGGTGKTRLSLQVGARLADRYPDGIFFVPLSVLREAELVPATIAEALGLPERGGLTPMAALIDHMRQRRLLLILDNFEQVTDSAAHLSELLAAAPGLSILATSRSPLRIYGEREYPVPPLATPDPRAVTTPEALSQYEAVALFIERAVAVKPDFTVTNENAPAVAEITSRLDGLPLAIELAAARINVLPPQAMLTRLEHRLSLLSGGSRDRPERQQTLRGAIDWSYDLLTDDERALFRRLAVFARGARLDAIDAVCPGDELGIDVLDGLTSLVDKSLLRQVADSDGEPRFLMLGVIRDYAVERLEESGRGDELRRRHAEHFTDLVAQAAQHLLATDKRRWLDLLEADHDNLRAALTWAQEQRQTVVALRLVSNLWRFWQMRGYLVEGSDWTRRALALPEVGEHAEEHADALEAAGGLAWWRADVDEMRGYYEACTELRRALGDNAKLAESLYNLSFAYGPFSAQGNMALSRTAIREARELWEGLGDDLGVAKTHWVEGSNLWAAGEYEESRPHFEVALPVFRKHDDSFLVGWTLYDLSLLEIHNREVEKAAEDLWESLQLFADAGDVSGYTLVLDAIAALEHIRGNTQEAARISGTVAVLERTSGTGLNSNNRLLIEFDPRPLREDPGLTSAWMEGEQTAPEDLVARLLARGRPSGAESSSPVQDRKPEAEAPTAGASAG